MTDLSGVLDHLLTEPRPRCEHPRHRPANLPAGPWLHWIAPLYAVHDRILCDPDDTAAAIGLRLFTKDVIDLVHTGKLCRRSTADLPCRRAPWVITARPTPIRRCKISITGVMQLVVQLAQETICWSWAAWLVLCTTLVTLSVLAGADSSPNLAPAVRCAASSGSRRKTAAHSKTRSTPSSDYGSEAGLRKEYTGIR